MYKLTNAPNFLNELIDKQFEMIGEKVKFKDVENGVKIKEGKKEKTVDWWKVYQWENEEQEQQYRNWAVEELMKKYDFDTDRELLSELNFLELVYGFQVKIKKEGFLF